MRYKNQSSQIYKRNKFTPAPNLDEDFGFKSKRGFTPPQFSLKRNIFKIVFGRSNDSFIGKRQSVKTGVGFTLIELMVVIAIIALLTSIALIALMSARQKSRDAKRLSDMTQMNTGLELYFATFRGYPSSSSGIPSALVPSYTSSLPRAPQPADGGCGSITYSPPVPAGTYGSGYYYYPSGTAYLGSDGITPVYPSYSYYFCLGNQTGNFSPGAHMLTPQGVR